MSHPFQTQEYRALFKKHFVIDPQTCVVIDQIEYELLSENRAVLVGMKPILNGQEITDFGNLDDTINIAKIHSVLGTQYKVKTVQYDYIKEHSHTFSELTKLPNTQSAIQEVSPIINLPSNWEDYLISLERTDRKELKRKWKRLDTVPHEFKQIEEVEKNEYFETFIKLHKLSDHNKNQFMTNPMRTFFKDLLCLSIPNWKQKLAFLYINNLPIASIFYFESNDSILLYNSGYDPEQKYYSGGLLLVTNLIKQAIEKKLKQFDFLRGNERYKYDLGGKDIQLYKFICTL